MRKSAIAIVASAVAMTVSATDYNFRGNNDGKEGSPVLTNPLDWTDAGGNHPATLFAPGDDYFLMGKTYWDHTIDFTASSLNLGSSSQDVAKTCSIGADVGSGYGIDNFPVRSTARLKSLSTPVLRRRKWSDGWTRCRMKSQKT